VKTVEAADYLNLETVYNQYQEATDQSFFSKVIDMTFQGEKLLGMQILEKIIPVGSYILALGEIRYDANTNEFSLHRPLSGKYPLIFSVSSLQTIYDDLKSRMSIYKWLGIFSVGLAAFLIYNRYYDKIQDYFKRKQLRDFRNNQRNNSTNNDSTFSSCVVCFDRSSDTLIMPCKHLVLCDQCADRLPRLECPVCKTPIEDFIRVYS
jgi:E3 ubiquitin-protein ligase MUL1